MCIDNVSNSMHIKYKQFAVDSSIYVVKVHLKSDDHAALRKKKMTSRDFVRVQRELKNT